MSISSVVGKMKMQLSQQRQDNLVVSGAQPDGVAGSVSDVIVDYSILLHTIIVLV